MSPSGQIMHFLLREYDPKVIQERLYCSRICVFFCFNLLNEEKKSLVYRLMYLPGSEFVDNELLSLGMQTPSGSLHSEFRKNLLDILAEPPQLFPQSDHQDQTLTLLLMFMTDGPTTATLPPILLNLLHSSNLLAKINDESSEITAKGFKFLLQPQADQIWFLFLQYIAQDPSPECFAEMVSAILLPSFSLSIQHRFFSLFDRRLCWAEASTPTRFLLVETNFKIYAYTHDPLQLAIISLFCRISGSFPNMSFGVISSESVSKAFARGISADQLVQFVIAHLHSNQPQTPSNVIDQIRIWERERSRISAVKSICYTDWKSPTHFKQSLEYLTQLGGLLYSSSQSRNPIIIAKAEFHNEMKIFFQTLKNM